MRRILSTLPFLVAAVIAHAISTVPAPGVLPTRSIGISLATLRIATDTVPELTPAERRELRRLEHSEARARRRSGVRPSDDASAGAKRSNGLAVASLATGIAGVLMVAPVFLIADAGIFLLFATAFACALVFGAIALRRANRKGRKHRGLAIAGFVLGILGAAYTVLTFLALATSDAG